MALQVLFQSEFAQNFSAEQSIGVYLENFEATTEVRDFATQLVNGVWNNKGEIDRLIQAHSQSWKVTRMAFVDKNILRIAVFELKFLQDHIPFQVALDEAIEIGKRYGSLESSAFINGVLDNIAKSLHQ